MNKMNVMQDFFDSVKFTGKGRNWRDVKETGDDPDENDLRTKVEKSLLKHYGPGPHPDGTPQSVHAGGESEVVSTGQSVGYPDIKVSFKKSNPSEFKTAIAETENRGAFLGGYSEDDYKKMNTYLSTDGKTGFAIKEDGDLVSVFNNGGVKGAGKVAIKTAIQQGASKLDCFDGFLPGYYSSFGFKEKERMKKERMKWDDQYAPPNWDYQNYNRPDVVFMGVGVEKMFAKLRKSLNTASVDKRYGKNYTQKYRQMFLDQLSYIESLGVPDDMSEDDFSKLKSDIENASK
jgi:hypothetical protein